MIIKRKLKTQIPSLKRCKLGNSASESRKKRKSNLGGYYYPLNLLGEIAAGIVPGGGRNGFSAPWSTQVSCSPSVEVEESMSKRRSDSVTVRDPPPAEVSRPPLVRTSRGRIQMLPSRFNDSVLENWRKDSKSDCDLEEEIECRNDKVSFRGSKVSNLKSKQLDKNRKYKALYKEDVPRARARVDRPREEEKIMKKEGFYGPEDFYSGDLVWAKSGRKEPFWPAIVIDPMTQAPELVLRSCIPDSACVVFFGHSGNQNERDYAWVRRGMIFPFVDYVTRFQEQSELEGCNPGHFQMALEEAFLADQGFMEKLMHDIHLAAGNSTFDDSFYRWIQETACSNQDLNNSTLSQEVLKKYRNPLACAGCETVISFEMAKKMKALIPGDQLLCKPCSRLTKSKHICGICKKIRIHLDSQSWVRCDGCKVRVHAECDHISEKHLKGVGETDYYCPTCRTKFSFELSDSEKQDSKSKIGKGDDGQMVLPDKVIVVCAGVEGIYFPRLHLVVCKCGFCGPQRKALSEWERHTGSKAKNWKTSVKVKSSKLALEEWMMKLAELHANATAAKVPKRPSIKQRKQRFFFYQRHMRLSMQSGQQNDVHFADWDYNKIIICNRSAMALDMFVISPHGSVKHARNQILSGSAASAL